MAQTDNGPLQAFEIGWACEVCGDQMTPSGQATATMLLSNPPQFPHSCQNGHTANLDARYPKVVFRRTPATA